VCSLTQGRLNVPVAYVPRDMNLAKGHEVVDVVCLAAVSHRDDVVNLEPAAARASCGLLALAPSRWNAWPRTRRYAGHVQELRLVLIPLPSTVPNPLLRASALRSGLAPRSGRVIWPRVQT
jgi:hypothetical protein